MSGKPLKVAPNGIVRKVAWALIKNRALLFARSRGQELFYSPGGKIEPGESSKQALIREIPEETDVSLVEDTIKLLHTLDGPCHGYVEGTILHMEYFTADYRGELAPKSEIEELAFFTSKDKHRTTAMGGQILDWFADQRLID